MAKRTITLSLDVEASGPIPGPWWMCSFGICRTDDPENGFVRTLKPLQIEGFSQPDTAAAMRIVGLGLQPNPWSEDATDEANVAAVRNHFEREGVDPLSALNDLGDWIESEVGKNRGVLVGSPVTFDFMWMYWYWWFLKKEMPPFGFSGLDIRSYFMGSHGVDFLGTGKERFLKHYPNDYAHTHDPLDDARQQGAIWRDMVAARLRKAAEEKAKKSL